MSVMPATATEPSHAPLSDRAAVEAAAWARFVGELADHLAGQWPAMLDRLGDRYRSFVELAVQQARQRGLTHAPSVARHVNLCFVWGPGFQDKPGFEWARAIVGEGARGGGDWLQAHQLLQRSWVELQRLPESRLTPAALLEADERLLARFGDLGHYGALHPAEAAQLARRACDLEVLDVRLLDDAAQTFYEPADDAATQAWQRVAQPLPAALRVNLPEHLPAQLSVLGAAEGAGGPARLQVRLKPHAVCADPLHPAVVLSGPVERFSWHGHETRAVSWPVLPRAQVEQPAGPGTCIAEVTSPELYRLDFEVCGLRDEGEPLGPLSTRLAVWPATQWWAEWQRTLPAMQSLWPGPKPWRRGTTRCRVERDGQSAHADALKATFEAGLDAQLAKAADSLATAWAQVDGLGQPSTELQWGVLVGQWAATWGWQHGPAGLAGDPVMRLVAQSTLKALQVDARLVGEMMQDGARSRITLSLTGEVPLGGEWRHEAVAAATNGVTPDVSASGVPTSGATSTAASTAALSALLLAQAQVRFRLPFSATVEPLATEAVALLQAAGPVQGALVGEVGLRPCIQGGSGWAWFAALRLEPVSLPLERVDPLLGHRRVDAVLLPAMTLLNWSQG